jgi:putative inorganic carbon (HCO3(-)) transporter
MMSARAAIAPARSSQNIVAWFDARPWLLVWIVLGSWAVVPELRRLIDWKIGFNSISIISIIPLLILVPFAIPLLYTPRMRRLERGIALCAWLWFGGFVYALMIALAQLNFLGASYEFAEFTLPAFFGLWLATTRVRPEDLYLRVASFMILSSTALSLYAVIQFVTGPPWDMAWLEATRLINIGLPAPFTFKPWSTMNNPGVFGDYLIIAMVLNLPRVRLSRPLLVAQMIFVLSLLILTQIRSDWLGFAVGLVTYVALSPNRLRNLTVLCGVAMLSTILIANASLLLGNSDAGNKISSRFNSLGDLNGDQSYDVRQQYFGDYLTEAIRTPVGQGLGVIGTAGKLGSSGDTVDFDNGYIARFTEMGYFGMACYLLAVFAGLAYTSRRYLIFRRAGDTRLAGIAAVAICIQMILIGLDLSIDHHTGFSGLFFWMSLAIVPHPAEENRLRPGDDA